MNRTSQFTTMNFVHGPGRAFVYQNPWGIFVAQVSEYVNEDFLSHRTWELFAEKRIAQGECLAMTYIVRTTPEWKERYGDGDRGS